MQKLQFLIIANKECGMDKRSWLLKAFKTIGLALILGANLTACGAGSQKWTEEVQLSDGKIIVVERELIREGGGDEWANNRSLSKPKEYRIQFADPNDSKKMVSWHSTKLSPQTWPEIPLILDLISGQLVIFSTVAKAGGCQMYNHYLYQNGVWLEEKLLPTFEQRATNLFVTGNGNELKRFVDLKTKQAITKEHGGVYPYASYDQVGPIHPNCKGL